MDNKKREILKEIFMEFKNGNKSSYEILYKEYFNIVYGAIFSIIKNKEISEDITQEVFLKIYNLNKESFPEQGELSWLYTVSKNEALGYLRKKREEIDIDEVYNLSNDSDEIDKLIDINTYKKMIKGLNKQEQEIISLKVLSNFTFKSIGQMLSMPTGTVQWKYYKAVSSLKISLANLAGAIIAFVLFIGRKVNLEKNRVNMSENDNFINSGTGNNMQIESTNKMESTNKVESNSTTNKAESSTTNKGESNSTMSFDNDFLPNYTNKDNYNSVSGLTSINPFEFVSIFSELKNIDIVQSLLIGISGLFLTLSIIFAIFFKNYQQKRKGKTSK